MNRTTQPPIQDLPHFNILAPVRTTLPNGIPLTIINAGEQEVVRIDFLFRGGRWLQSQKLQALFTNRMLREGTRKYSASQIAEKLDYYGAWLELSNSAEYAHITLYSLNKYVAKTIDILESMLKEPLFSEKELATVLDSNIQQYLVNATKVDHLAQRSLMDALYGNSHPAGQYALEDDYRKITPQTLHSFYAQYYHSSNCAIFVAGKATNEIVHQIETCFGTAPFGNHQQLVAQKEYSLLTIPQKRVFIEQDSSMQSAVKLGNITISRQHPDCLKMQVMVTLFGGYFGSRLMSNIREEKGYTYGISAGVAFYPHSGTLLISTETDSKYVEPLIHEVYHEMDRLHNELVPIQELTTVRNYMLGEMCRSYESPFSLADAWIFVYTSGLHDDYFRHSLEAVRSITVEEIRELSCRYLCKETLKEVIAGKKLA